MQLSPTSIQETKEVSAWFAQCISVAAGFSLPEFQIGKLDILFIASHDGRITTACKRHPQAGAADAEH